ncbi:FadR family transcriptional regulator [Pikeienuella piscinae]|uniref:FadR family transcriptional regulator n=1 Tax=Pikeienuella piscinae TaxID=2748098 RepID=A0A7M3T5U8_9RHOB|nr:FadR/GntR family transcriptional regulator [Pikeienuella piscinae]QIE57379.1 FadR family transcriptional regulator [Pikeienuella piscinae]
MAKAANKKGAAEIASRLKRAILGGELIENERLPAERALAEAHDVSRGTIREALSRLSKEGLVSIRRGSGAYVTYVAPSDDAPLPIEDARPLELMDARFALEPHICRLSVLHATQADFATLETLLNLMEGAVDDPTVFAETDAEFHSALARSSGNSLLTGILQQMKSVRGLGEWARMRQLTLNRETIRKYNIEHRRIVNALRAREPERAAMLMKDHLETARLSLTRAAAT